MSAGGATAADLGKGDERVRVCPDLGAHDPDPALRVKSLHHRRAYIAELLRAFSGIDLGGVEVALGVDRQVVHPVELAWITAWSPEGADDGARLAVERQHLVVAAVGQEQPLLLRIARDHQVPHRAVAGRARLDRELPDETAVLAEDLVAIADRSQTYTIPSREKRTQCTGVPNCSDGGAAGS